MSLERRTLNMSPERKVLIVENDYVTVRSYSIELEQRKMTPRIAGNLSEALTALDEQEFPAAIVDLSLKDEDRSNTDGLTVLSTIQHLGDRTKTILVTGYGTMAIARAALKQLDAFDVAEKVYRIVDKADHLGRGYKVDKGEIVEAKDGEGELDQAFLTNFMSLVQAAVQDFEEEVHKQAFLNLDPLRRLFSGSSLDDDIKNWEYTATRLMKPLSGIASLYELYRLLFFPYMPLIARRDDYTGIWIDINDGVAHERFWSRACGKGVLICFGEVEAVKAFKRTDLFKRTERSALRIRSEEEANILGLVLEIGDWQRADFGH